MLSVLLTSKLYIMIVKHSCCFVTWQMQAASHETQGLQLNMMQVCISLMHFWQ